MEPKCRCLELEERVSKAEESYIEQMMVNKALEFEKHVIEKEAEDCKRKFDKLVETVQKLDRIGAIRYGDLVLDENLKLGLELAKIKIPIRNETELGHKDGLNREGLTYHRQRLGSPYITTPVKDNIMGRHRDSVSKMLVFEDHVCCEYKYSEDEEDVEGCEVNTSTSPFGLKRKRVITSENESDDKDTLEERSVDENYDDEDVETCEVNINTPLSCRKRKQVITSDSENDDEDNMPISILKKPKSPNQEMSDCVERRQRRVLSRLKKQRVSEDISALSERNPTGRLVGIPTTGNADEDETEEEESESESESMDGFIVDDDSHDDENVSEKSYETGEEETNGESGYADVMSRLRRDKKPEKQRIWEYEADMLADFGKDPELCMRAVCVLYRFQTEDEKFTRSSHVCNDRGFNKFDAIRGTRIGKFLTEGDSEGDLKKSVEELKSFEFEGVEVCRALADRYSTTV